MRDALPLSPILAKYYQRQALTFLKLQGKIPTTILLYPAAVAINFKLFNKLVFIVKIATSMLAI